MRSTDAPLGDKTADLLRVTDAGLGLPLDAANARRFFDRHLEQPPRLTLACAQQENVRAAATEQLSGSDVTTNLGHPLNKLRKRRIRFAGHDKPCSIS